jgi:hypothetical protein
MYLIIKQIYKKKKQCFVFLCGPLLCIIFLYSFAGGAETDTWRIYYVAPEGTQYHYDPESITISHIRKQTRSVRRRRTNIGERHIKVTEKVLFSGSDGDLREMEMEREFRCPYRKVRIHKLDTKYRDGRRTIELKTNSWEDIKAGSPSEVLYRELCPQE